MSKAGHVCAKSRALLLLERGYHGEVVSADTLCVYSIVNTAPFSEEAKFGPFMQNFAPSAREQL